MIINQSYDINQKVMIINLSYDINQKVMILSLVRIIKDYGIGYFSYNYQDQ